MNELQSLFEQVSKYWGWHVGVKVKEQVEAIIQAENVDVERLQSAIETIQGLLDADPSTPEFDVGQNIVAQLTDHLTRITALEGDMTTLKGDENTVGSVAYAVKQEADRAKAVEANLQSAIDAEAQARESADADLQSQIDALKGEGEGSIGSLQAELDATQAGAGLGEDGAYTANTSTNYISEATSLKDADEKLDAAIKTVETATAAAQAKADANEAAIGVLNGDENTEGSVKKIANDAATASGAAALASAKEYADATFVKKEDVTAISAQTLASMFKKALDCGFNGASIEDVLNGTGDCAQASGGNDGGDGDGAVV